MREKKHREEEEERGLTPVVVVESPAAVEERKPDDGRKDTDREKENRVQGSEVRYNGNGNGIGGGGAIKTNKLVSLLELMKDALAMDVDNNDNENENQDSFSSTDRPWSPPPPRSLLPQRLRRLCYHHRHLAH